MICFRTSLMRIVPRSVWNSSRSHLYDRNRRHARVVIDEMHAANPDVEAALRRLLADLERPARLSEWRRREPAEQRRDLPKSAQRLPDRDQKRPVSALGRVSRQLRG